MLLEKAGIKVVEQPTTRPARNGRRQRGGDSVQDGPTRGSNGSKVQEKNPPKPEPVREAAVGVKPI